MKIAIDIEEAVNGWRVNILSNGQYIADLKLNSETFDEALRIVLDFIENISKAKVS